MLNAHIRFVSFLILLSGLLFSGNALPQEENSEQETNPPSTIVIGITSKSINPSLDSESLGVYWGVNVEYLRNIAKILNINIQLKHYSNVVELLHDVETGAIDGTVGFAKTPERMNRFLFSKPLFKSSVSIWFKESFYQTRPFSTLNWTCVKGTSYCEYLRIKGIKNIHYALNFTDAVAIMNKGQANAFISSFVTINEYLDKHDVVRGAVEIPDWIEPEEISFITAKNNVALMESIDKVLEWEVKGKNIRSVASNNLYHLNDRLLSEYRREHHDDDVITFSTSNNAYPFFEISDNGEQRGLLADFLDLIRSRSGLDFEYKSPIFEHNQELATFNANIIPVAYIDRVESPNWLLTKPFMQIKFHKVGLASAKAINNRKPISGILLSLQKQGLIHINAWNNENFREYSDIKKLMKDLEDGKIQSAYMSDDVLYSLLSQFNKGHLKVDKSQEKHFSIAFSVSNHDVKLKKLLDSIIDTIDSKEIEKINKSYRDFNLTYGYDSEKVIFSAIIISVLLIIVAIIIYFVISNMKLKVSLAEINADNEEKEKQWLTQIIQELNNKVFIHDDKGQLVLSNCSEYLKGNCTNCQIKNAATQISLVGDFEEVQQVLSGKRIKEYSQTVNCDLQIEHIYRERKAIRSLDHRKQFVLTVLQDVTAQKEREAALIAAQHEAQSAVKARERFLATMSHELRTPLAATYGLLDLVATHSTSERDKELVLRAKQSLNHLNLLVDEVLDYSKLEAGELQIHPAKNELLRLLSQTLRGFEAKANSKGLDYTVNIIPFSLRWAMIDDLRFNQIVSNLISNAIKFTEQGDITLTAQVVNERLLLTIKDTGIGMTQEQLANIFKPFVQADDSITRQFGGTGLGLAIVEQLLKQMGGHIALHSALNVGTQVDIELPLTLCEGAYPELNALSYSSQLPTVIQDWCQCWGLVKNDANPSVNKGLSGECNTLSCQPSGCQRNSALECTQYPDALLDCLLKMTSAEQERHIEDIPMDTLAGKVLVAEDNKINQHIVKMQFAELGLTPIVVNNGIEALNYIKQHGDVALLLTDFHMPEMDGYELVRTLRANERFATLPVVGVTAEDSRIANEKSMQSGINEILYKPYDLKQLGALLARYLAKPKARENWLDKFSENDAQEVAKVFIVEMAKDLTQLKQAESGHQMRAAVHKVKGACGALGIQHIVALCEDAESVDMAHKPALVEKVISELDAEINRTIMWMESYA
ncbi:TPA: transporter substrate-binding domain-containing protein [Vibrio vulnificus]|nr:transporter substrate-binding domain-containing protein [Vibrio vulnificus]HDZ3738824.1 transporter substrate-binding domain-containing protein [Vibrio vulnificus]HEB2777272.1 transporter substrate-binding domain-containing protein [Vibrio vulnificus]HEB2779677.1 transporter substrate-binding domain-containing protein [Vibrio vulnificus]